MIPKSAMILGESEINCPLVLITTIGRFDEVKGICAKTGQKNVKKSRNMKAHFSIEVICLWLALVQKKAKLPENRKLCQW